VTFTLPLQLNKYRPLYHQYNFQELLLNIDGGKEREKYICFYSLYAVSLYDGSSESPPLYVDAVNETCQRTIMVLTAQSIHPESADSALVTTFKA
jgi:hypothetical protein